MDHHDVVGSTTGGHRSSAGESDEEGGSKKRSRFETSKNSSAAAATHLPETVIGPQPINTEAVAAIAEDTNQPGPSNENDNKTTHKIRTLRSRNYRPRALLPTDDDEEDGDDEELENIFNKCLTTPPPPPPPPPTQIEEDEMKMSNHQTKDSTEEESAAVPLVVDVEESGTTASVNVDLARQSSNDDISNDAGGGPISDNSQQDVPALSSSSSSSSDDVLNFNENDSNDDDDDDDGGVISTSDDDDDEIDVNRFSGTARKKINEENSIVQSILHKPRPRYAWSTLPAVCYRQHGIVGPLASGAAGGGANGGGGGDGSSTGGGSRHRQFVPAAFERQMYGSLFSVERLELMYKLEKHRGCVNALNFNKSGNLLVTGSDDLRIILWKWASNEILTAHDSGHLSNIFQTKFLELHNGGIDIASSSRDGQIRHSHFRPDGQIVSSKILAKHSSAVNKLTTAPNDPFELFSAGEDGRIVRIDLREGEVERLVTVRSQNQSTRIPLYSISHHPMDPDLCVSGRDNCVRVYDKRNTRESVKLFSPELHINVSQNPYNTHITCAIYNYLGTEILASCSTEIYLFDAAKPHPSPHTHVYSGHRNYKTIKGVNFFGPRSEYIVSGSDCGNCFFWDKETEAIVQWMPADESGAVNCIETHPSFPILATSGLDHDIKIFVPSNEKAPRMLGLQSCVRKNVGLRFACDTFHDQQMLNFYVRLVSRNQQRRREFLQGSAGTVPVFRSESSDDDDDDDDIDEDDESSENELPATLPCAPS